ncbi:hypothetical protein DB346_14450 [Verrucomicrobia bacterium LW23]|nr:hypothetical protein DB346_14450 [Verrucomicrobia bacterium LW23]
MQLTLSEALGAIRSPSPGAAGFALRTTVAVLLSLFWAFAMNLESPGWAPTTAIVLASPYHGQVISKGVYRLIGTCAGASMAVFIVAVFAQTPELCLLVVALWIGGCMFAATMLRNFVAYGAMLAGFSASVVVLGALPDHPLRVLDIALARVCAIALGILATALVAGIFTPGGATRQMNDHLRRLLTDLTHVLRTYSSADFAPQVAPRRRALAGEIIALDSHIVFASAETHLVREQREGLVGIGAALMHALTAVGGTGFSWRWMTPEQRAHPDFVAAMGEALDAGRRIEAWLAGPDDSPPPRLLEHAGRVRRLAKASISGPAGAEKPGLMNVAIHRVRETLEHLHVALAGYAEWRAGKPVVTPPRVQFSFHTHPADALLNGARCCLLILAAGAFWILTAWPAGGFLVSLVAAYVCVASVQKNPAAFGPPFVVGTLIALPVVGWISLVPMSMIEGFVPLAVVLGVPVFMGALAWGCSADAPRVSTAGFAFLLIFILMLAPTNPAVFNAAEYFNRAIATLIAILLSVGSSVFLLPLDPHRRAHLLIRTMCCEVEDLVARAGAAAHTPSRAQWESRMYDRLCGSMPFLSSEQKEADVLSSAFAALQIGATIIDVREAAAAELDDRMPRGHLFARRTAAGVPGGGGMAAIRGVLDADEDDHWHAVTARQADAAWLSATVDRAVASLSAMAIEPVVVAQRMHRIAGRLAERGAAVEKARAGDFTRGNSFLRIAISLEGIALLLDSYGQTFSDVRHEIMPDDDIDRTQRPDHHPGEAPRTSFA